jgi:hypothetical protein
MDLERRMRDGEVAGKPHINERLYRCAIERKALFP